MVILKTSYLSYQREMHVNTLLLVVPVEGD